MPIIEHGSHDLRLPTRREAGILLLAQIQKHLDKVPARQAGHALKLTLPERRTSNRTADRRFPASCASWLCPAGYSRDPTRMPGWRRNNGMIASFSRALTESLSQRQNDAEFVPHFDRGRSYSIFEASRT